MFFFEKILGDKKHPNHRPNQQSPCWTWELIKTLCFVSPSSRWHCQNFHKILLPYLSYWGGGFQWPFLICWSVYQRSHFALWSALSSLPRRFCAYLGAVQRRVLPRWWRWWCWWQWWWLLLILWWLYNVDPEVLRVWKFVSLNLACELLSLLVFDCFIAAACLSAWLFVNNFLLDCWICKSMYFSSNQLFVQESIHDTYCLIQQILRYSSIGGPITIS